MLLAFHVQGKLYCKEYRLDNAEKRFCDVAVNYIHFYLSLEGYPLDESKYLVALLPRVKNYNELEKLADELCKVTEWLEIKEKTNCLVFRYGPPVHGTDNIKYWQKQFEKSIEATRQLYIVHRMEGRIKHISILPSAKNLTISKNSLFDAINIS
jgi:hypothetical protein